MSALTAEQLAEWLEQAVRELADWLGESHGETEDNLDLIVAELRRLSALVAALREAAGPGTTLADGLTWCCTFWRHEGRTCGTCSACRAAAVLRLLADGTETTGA